MTIPFQLQRQQGQAMVLVVFAVVIVGVLATTLIDLTTSESTRSVHAVTADASYQAAEAGIDDYVAKLLDDHLFYQHDVAAGESTRTDVPNGGTTTVSSTATAAKAWTGKSSWTYANGRDNWRQLANGYWYNLQVYPPTGSTGIAQTVEIRATGRHDYTSSADQRVIDTLIRPSSVADWQMLSNVSVTYGNTATTYGKIYSNGNIDHSGTAYADLYAWGKVNTKPTFKNGATYHDSTTSPTIQTMFNNTKVDFSVFLNALVDIKRAAQATAPWGGVYLDKASDGTTPDAWEITFNSNGTFTAKSCRQTGSQDVAYAAPTCYGTTYTYNVPANGAIYAEETVILAGGTSTCGPEPVSNANCVNGRVTVGSANDIVIADDTEYVDPTDDVLGLIAANDMIVAYWSTPDNGDLTWRAATLAQTGQWTDWCGVPGGGKCGSKDTMTFYGSTATANGGSMSMFDTRNYNYDANLLYLQPPWYPAVENAYTIVLQRELPTGS